MSTPQSGIFALGTASHAYLELDAGEQGAARELVSVVASLREPRTTMGGINLVTGFRPDLWRVVAPDDAPPGLQGFDADLVGAEGYRMPATQHDAVLWLSGSAYDVVFECARAAIAALYDVATVAEETSSWPYQHDRDLTGFIDGSENPTLIEAPEFAVIGEGPGAGGTILLLQKWSHDAAGDEVDAAHRRARLAQRGDRGDEARTGSFVGIELEIGVRRRAEREHPCLRGLCHFGASLRLPASLGVRP